MKGEKSRETAGVARVFLRKNTRKKAVFFTIGSLGVRGVVITAGKRSFDSELTTPATGK